MHTEKFWKENAKFAEANEFEYVKKLVALLKSEDAVSALTFLRFTLSFAFSFSFSFSFFLRF